MTERDKSDKQESDQIQCSSKLKSGNYLDLESLYKFGISLSRQCRLLFSVFLPIDS